MKFLIVGYGSIGKRHCDNLKNILKNKENISICRQYSKRKVPEFNTFFDLDEAILENPDAVIITNPPSLHLPTALKFAKKGINLFIEKPLSNSLEQTKNLSEIIERKGLIAMIGCNMRFHPGIRKVKELIDKRKVGKITSVLAQAGQYLPDWRPKTDYSESYSSNKELGGGVTLDLIHELDYLYWFFGPVKSIFAMIDKKSNLNIDTEDTADILIDFKNNVQTNLHLDYLQRYPQRNCQIIGEKGTIFWDYFDKSVKLYGPGKNFEKFDYKNFERNEMYVKEMEHFFSCIKNKRDPLINLKQGIEVLKLILLSKESSQ